MPQVWTASRPVLASHSGGGFFVRRVATPGIVVAKCTIKPLARRARIRLSNKENVPPAGAVKAAAPKSRSPLPDWYPRTPLHDITSIVKALERRSRLEAAAAQQQIQRIEDSSQSVDPTPVQAEQDDPQSQSTQQAQETLGAGTSGPGSTSVVANLTTSVAESKMESSSPSDCSLQTVQSKPNDSVLADLMEKKLSRSIEQIEKMVGQRLKETPKAAQPSKVAVQRRTLMSMR